MQKRGQAAIEFLTTYGWAILLLIVAVAAIIGLGVFNPQTPNICNADPPFICTDVVFREGGFEATLTTSDISSASVVANEILINNIQCEKIKVKGKSVGDLNLINGINKIVCYNNINLIKEKDKIKVSLNLNYKATESSASHKVSSSMNGRVERSSYIKNFDSSALLSLDFESSNNNLAIDDSSYGNNAVLYSGNTICSGDGNEVVINGGMEQATSGLANGWSSSVSYVTSDAEPQNIFSGARTQKIVATNTAHSRFTQGFNGHTPNGKYHLKASYKAVPGGVKRILGVYNMIDGINQGLLFNYDLIEDNNWHTIDSYFIVPSDSNGGGYIDMPRIDSLTGTTTVYIDEVSIKEAFCPNLISDLYGKSVNLDGINDYARVQNINLVDNTPLSIEMLIKFNAVSSDIRFLSFDNQGDRIRLKAQPTLGADYNPSTTSQNVNSNIVPQTNTSYYLAMVLQNNQPIKFYVNGNEFLGSTINGIDYKANADVWIGSDTGGSGPTLNGNIDNVRIYNRVLSPGEIAQHYQNSKL